MRILLVTQHYWPYDSGGSGISVRALAEGLAKAGDRVHVLAQAPGDADESREHNGVHVRHMAKANRWASSRRSRRGAVQRALGQLAPEWHPTLLRSLRKHVESTAPDILHTHVVAGTSSRIWGRAGAMGIPVVHTLRDYYMLCARGTMLQNRRRCGSPCLDCRFFTRRRRRDTQHVEALVGLSAFVLDRHRDAGLFRNAKHHLVIPNGHEQLRAPAPRDRASSRLRVGFLARLHPSKGVETLIDAIREFGPDIRAIVAGEGEPDYASALEQRAQGCDIEFVGHVDPDALLLDIDALVVPSIWEEPFGRVLLEAFARGVPVVCSRRGGAQELIDEGQNGWLFEPETTADLTRVLRGVAARELHEVRRMREHCLHTAERYDVARMIDAHRDLYAKLMREPGAS